MRNNIVIVESKIASADETMVLDDRDNVAPAELVTRRLNEMAGDVPGAHGRHVNAKTGRRPERSRAGR